jgi:hypothetical protein
MNALVFDYDNNVQIVYYKLMKLALQNNILYVRRQFI